MEIEKQKAIQEVIDNHNSHLEEFWNEDEDIEKLKINDLESFLDKITAKIGNFGFGETDFHTSDIEFMRIMINKLVDNEILDVNCVTSEMKECKCSCHGYYPNGQIMCPNCNREKCSYCVLSEGDHNDIQ